MKQKFSKLPKMQKGSIKTLNKMGVMMVKPDIYNQAFIQYVGMTKGSVLEVGSAYGVTTHALLKTGAQVYANDLEAKHLDILYANAPEPFRKNLHLFPGSFLTAVYLPKESVSGILASRVLQFLTGDQIENGLQKFWHWLRPGGKLYVVNETPYTGYFEKFIFTFEERKKKGLPWPGFLTDVRSYCDMRRMRNLPTLINLQDVDTLTQALEKSKFVIEKAEMFGRKDFSAFYQLDGRENVGVIAVKA